MMFLRLGLAVILFAAAAAPAQEAVYLAPAKYSAAVGEGVAVPLREGATGKAWDDAEVAWVLVRVAGTQENLDRAPRADGAGGKEGEAGVVKVERAGAAVIGVDFVPRNLERKKEGGAADRVTVIRSAKMIVRVGESERGQSANVTAKTGQQVELRPTFDPTAVGIGSDVPLVVYAGDGKAPGAKLTAVHVASGERQEFVANGGGVGSFRLGRAGKWRIEARHEVEREGRRVVYLATLSFEARGAG